MIKENNKMYKIAIIDYETDLISILEEQKDTFTNYSWVHFKSIKKLFGSKSEGKFCLYLINETIVNHSSFKISDLNIIREFVPILFILSPNNKYRDKLLTNLFRSKILNKPFQLNFFINMIDEILLSHDKKRMSNFNIGSYVLKPSEKKLINNSNIKIMLTDIEVKILVKLCEHHGEYVKKDEVFRRVWGKKNSDTTHTLQTHIYRLRKKLSSKFGANILIKSKVGKYSLKYQ